MASLSKDVIETSCEARNLFARTVISIAAEIKKAREWMPFIFLEWNDDRIEKDFRQSLHLNSKWEMYYHKGYKIIEYVPNEDNLRKELEKRGIHANGAVMAAMDALKRFGSIRIAH